MAELFHDLRWIHIAAGTIALIVFWIPVAASKGGRLHVKVGWIYACCMSVVVLTALSMSGLAFAAPLGVRHFTHVLSASEAAQFVRSSRESAFFLAYLGGVTLAALWQGIGVLRTRRDPKSFRTPFVFALNTTVVLTALASLTMGIFTRTATFAAMSIVGFIVSGGNLFYLLRGPKERMDWWYQHLGSMIATGIAGYTAFIVFGGRHLLAPLVRPEYYVMFWLLPTAIGSPAIALTTAYYKRKFGGGGRAAKSSGPEATAAV
jgi:hypothetical protein